MNVLVYSWIMILIRWILIYIRGYTQNNGSLLIVNSIVGRTFGFKIRQIVNNECNLKVPCLKCVWGQCTRCWIYNPKNINSLALGSYLTTYKIALYGLIAVTLTQSGVESIPQAFTRVSLWNVATVKRDMLSTTTLEQTAE